MKNLFLCFVIGIICGGGAVVLCSNTMQPLHVQSPLLISPEAVINADRLNGISRSLNEVIQDLCKLNDRSQDNVFKTRLILNKTADLKLSEPINPSGMTSIYWLLDAACQLSGATMVWTGNEIEIFDSMREPGDITTLKIAPGLLYNAVCNNSPGSLPVDLVRISKDQEIELLDALNNWGIEYLPASEADHQSSIRGHLANIKAVMVELASHYNKVQYNKLYLSK